ncbi:S-layer homology domain-containing protein, partial [Candidatus Peregrinibacteria bacterium]|nr:S-layer homology domain-containing protein [Candidatus Peregrinibacteria bacterium]
MEKLHRSIAGLSLIALLTSLVGFSAIAYAQSFSDVDTDHWAYESVEDLYAQGVVEGYD